MSRIINVWARFWLGLKSRDNSGSYRCYRLQCLANIDWSLAISRGYAFQEEILYRCRRAGCRIVEVPITFEDRRFGSTKINWKECLIAVLDITRLGFQNLRKVPVLKSTAVSDQSTDKPADNRSLAGRQVDTKDRNNSSGDR